MIEKDSIPIEEFARDFYVDRRERGYWKHILAFWDRRQDDDVLALSYENMKQDLPGTIERVAEFMEIDLDAELKAISVRQVDIKFMTGHNNQFDDHLVRETRNAACHIPADGVTSKVKNGNIGDSRLQVPPEILMEFDQIWQEEITAQLGLSSYKDLQQDLR